MTHKFGSCLWLKEKPQETADFYLSVFEDARQTNISYFVDDLHGSKGDILTITLELGGHEFFLLNGGPDFTPTPAVSYVVTVATEAGLRKLWAQLSAEGDVLMELSELPGIGLFGWTNDRYGFSWQLKLAKGKQTITPALLFANELYGRADEAMTYWFDAFGQGEVLSRVPDSNGNIQIAEFQLYDQHFYSMDSEVSHNFGFSMANSFFVYCENQKEIDRLWQRIALDGAEYPCGWMQDKFGVAWQTVTEDMNQLFDAADFEKAYQTTMAMYEMKKIDIELLRKIHREA
ncbi:VOC family protein [Enterococcus sp. LJL51]|uniref:VOC family protein n=1 Tax=Enterococcus sp. LJL51 TaxID=3416656 RepID=UPI003CE8A8CE